MPTRSKDSTQDTVASVPAGNFDGFMAGLGQKDRGNVTKYLDLADAEPTPHRGRLWRRLVTLLHALAPHANKTTGMMAVQFYVPDGKHRLQVFALEDRKEGNLYLYTPDVIDKAIKAKILGASTPGGDGGGKLFSIGTGADETVRIETLTAASTLDAPEFYKHMLGWNRKAVRVTIPVGATTVLIKSIEQLCMLAAPPTPPAAAAK